MRINKLSEGFESYFLHSVISNTFRVEGFVGAKSCGEKKLQNLKETFAKFAKRLMKNNFLSQISQQDFFQREKTLINCISSSLCV